MCEKAEGEVGYMLIKSIVQIRNGRDRKERGSGEMLVGREGEVERREAVRREVGKGCIAKGI